MIYQQDWIDIIEEMESLRSSVPHYRNMQSSQKPAPPELNPIEKMVEKIYPTDILKKLYTRYIRYFFSEKDLGNLKKLTLVRALAKIYSDRELFNKLVLCLPPQAKRLFHILIWEGGEHKLENLEKHLNIRIVKGDRRYYQNPAESVENDYLLFPIHSTYDYPLTKLSFYLPEPLRKIFKQHLPFPKEYELISLDKIEKTDFLYEDNDEVIRQIKLWSNYLKHGELKVGDKVLKTALKEMATYCGIKEFYEHQDRELDYIKTRFIINLLQKIPLKNVDTSPEFLKELFTRFFYNQNSENYQLHQLLSYLKNKGYYFEYDDYKGREQKVRESLFELLRGLPLSSWVCCENLVKYARAKGIYLELINIHTKWEFYYTRETPRTYGHYLENIRISNEIYKDAVIVPFVKTVMFLFATFGIVDIAYNLPKNEVLQEKDHPYLSIYDGLQYVRLTKLGAYILGLIEKYEVEIKEEKTNIILDERRLIIHIEGTDRLKRMVLEKVATPISDNHYKVDYESFFKDCNSKEDIKRKVEFFKGQISSNLPEIWHNFLNEILEKINPLNCEEKMAVYRLKKDKELISLIATDEVLKKYILKAEDYCILIDKSNLGKVKKRLREFGYLIDNM
ncbi:MAG: hypothetical protein AB1422_14720 [bacterium]